MATCVWWAQLLGLGVRMLYAALRMVLAFMNGIQELRWNISLEPVLPSVTESPLLLLST